MFDLRGHVVWEFQIYFPDPLICLVMVCSLKRRVAAKELVAEDTQAPNIDLVIVGSVSHHFRREVIKSTTHSPSSIIGCVDTPSKVRNLDSPQTIEQVLWLDVSMDHILVMQILQSLAQLVNIVSCYWLWVSAVSLFLQFFVELSPRGVL